MSDIIGTPPTFADVQREKDIVEALNLAHQMPKGTLLNTMGDEMTRLRARVQELQDKNARLYCIADALLDNYDWWSVDEVDRARIWVDDIEELRDALRGGAR